jgi:hypothetical protein
MAAFVVLLGSVARVLAYSGFFYVTVSQWCDACYEKKFQHSKQLSPGDEPTTPDSRKAIIWGQCERLSNLGIYNAGLIFGGNPDYDAGAKALGKSCPSSWLEVPLAGSYFLTVNMVRDQGGPSILDRFLPAESMIGRVYQARWPTCVAERIRLGFPKIVEVHPGLFDWQTPCARCATDKGK